MQQKDGVGRQWNLGSWEVVEGLNPLRGLTGLTSPANLITSLLVIFTFFAVFVHQYTCITLHWLTSGIIVLFR
jgi:hypothetical protein